MRLLLSNPFFKVIDRSLYRPSLYGYTINSFHRVQFDLCRIDETSIPNTIENKEAGSKKFDLKVQSNNNDFHFRS